MGMKNRAVVMRKAATPKDTVPTSIHMDRVERVQRLQVEERPTDEVIQYDRNPGTHTDQQVGQIAESIARFGWTNPILIGPDNLIIAGHARWLAARRLGMSKVPVIVLKGLSPAERKALVIADNRLALRSEEHTSEL